MNLTPARLLLLAAFVFVCLPVGAVAQEEEATPWLQMSVIGVEPAQVDEFVAAQRELSALDEKAGVAWRAVHRTAVFGDRYRFVVMTPLAGFAELDRSGRGDAARASLMGRIERTITSSSTYALRSTPGVDAPLPDDEEPALAIVQIVSVTPGREQDYMRVMSEEVLPHFGEAEMYHATGALTLGGESGYIHFFHVPNFAALDQGSPMARALGPEAAQAVLAKLQGVVTDSEQWVIRYLPDLSFVPKPEEEDPDSR